VSELLDSNGNPIDDGQGLTLTDHLGELRDRLIKSAYGILIMMGVGWMIREKVLESIIAPVQKYVPNGKLIYLSPTDMFMAHIKVTAMLGIIFSCPIWLYQLWKFISPGLYAHEKKYSIAFIGSGVTLFLLGSSFCYFLVLPAALKFLLEFGSNVGQAMLTLSEYLSFFVTMILVFGAAFEMPLVIVLLGLFGIVDQKFLRDKRRYAVVILAILAAIVTPPDLLSMLMLLVPLMVLYEISILVVGVTGRRKAPEDSRV
jgi:sec-independent protein translocase protein TatC